MLTIFFQYFHFLYNNYFTAIETADIIYCRKILFYAFYIYFFKTTRGRKKLTFILKLALMILPNITILSSVSSL